MESRSRAEHRTYLERLRRMTPEQKLQMAFELTEKARAELREKLRKEFPDATEEELHRIFVGRWNNSDE